MPWTQTDPMQERTRFITAYHDGLYSMSELCARFHISRKTGYKWLQRYHQHGLDGLKDLSRTPKTCPHQTTPEVEALLVESRRKHPHWGPRKLRRVLERHHPTVTFPALSTIGAILDRNGLIETKPRRRKAKHPGATPLKTEAPNDVWGTDFKGEFKLLNGQYCYPLTVTDLHSRYILACHALPSTGQEGTIEAFQGLFREYGLPQAVRTDNGNPFATSAIVGLSKLNAWWIKLGIDHQRIEPGEPQQNGRHERMHRTLKAETTRPPERSMAKQQTRFDAFVEEFNQQRPHEALDDEVPASCFHTSARALPAVLPAPEYALHWEKRWVSKCGTFRFKCYQPFVSTVLAHEWIALEEVDDGVWSVYFYDVLLARFDERDGRLHT